MRIVLALLLACGAAPSVMGQSVGDSLGRVVARVLPETVTVGQPFIVTLRVIPPLGRKAVAPAVPDTGGIVEPLDPALINRRGDTLLVRYRLLAWQPGVLTVPFEPVIMRRDSSEVSVPLDVRVVVSSVLPADTAMRTPRNTRELFPRAAPWWQAWWPWALAMLAFVAIMLVFEWWRRRRKPLTPAPASADGRATAAFARLDSLQLLSLGETGRHVALTGEIVRQYLADIDSSLPVSKTSEELAQALTGVPVAVASDVRALFRTVDAVRFSAAPVDAATARDCSDRARFLVRDLQAIRQRADAAPAA
jgi:hypothetical protein